MKAKTVEMILMSLFVTTKHHDESWRWLKKLWFDKISSLEKDDKLKIRQKIFPTFFKKTLTFKNNLLYL